MGVDDVESIAIWSHLRVSPFGRFNGFAPYLSFAAVPFDTFQSSKFGRNWNIGTRRAVQLVREASLLGLPLTCPWLRRLFRGTSPDCGSISSRRSQAQCWRYQRASACASEDVAQVHSRENQSRSADFTNLNSGNQRSAGEDEYLPTGNNIRDSVRPTV